LSQVHFSVKSTVTANMRQNSQNPVPRWKNPGARSAGFPILGRSARIEAKKALR
jgi:hypothetical protein